MYKKLNELGLCLVGLVGHPHRVDQKYGKVGVKCPSKYRCLLRTEYDLGVS